MTMMLSSCEKIYICFTYLISLMFIEPILKNVRLWGLKIFINTKINRNPVKKTRNYFYQKVSRTIYSNLCKNTC
jgi:hypothetical protein